jgi:hypothetical protein
MAKKPITEIASSTPQSLTFGVIVAIVMFWAEFIRSVMQTFFDAYFDDSTMVTNLLMAIIISIAGYALLITYRKVYYALKKLKV